MLGLCMGQVMADTDMWNSQGAVCATETAGRWKLLVN